MIRRAANLARAAHFTRGWLSELYAGLWRRAVQGLGWPRERTSADLDPHLAGLALQGLVADLEEGAAQQRWVAALRDHVANQVMRLEPEDVFTSLLAPDGDELGEPITDFSATVCPGTPSDEHDMNRSWRPLPRTPGYPTLVHLWLPACVSPADPALRSQRASWTIDDEAEVLILPSVRLDIAGPGLWSHHELFDEPPDPPDAITRLSDTPG